MKTKEEREDLNKETRYIPFGFDDEFFLVIHRDLYYKDGRKRNQYRLLKRGFE